MHFCANPTAARYTDYPTVHGVCVLPREGPLGTMPAPKPSPNRRNRDGGRTVPYRHESEDRARVVIRFAMQDDEGQ
jgi:hypothetical protein